MTHNEPQDKTADKPTLKQADLFGFTGTEVWYMHPLVRGVTYTEGVRHLAEAGQAYWLIDFIACWQVEELVTEEPFQVWYLKLNGGGSATLTCEDGNGRRITTQDIDYTDFPFAITLYFTGGVLMLTSEY